MPKWVPGQEWEGEDAYIIGGGPSLRTFDWELIRGEHTLGCNSAFVLGADICEILVFGDHLWWRDIGKAGTEEYGGRVVGCSRRIYNDPCPWLLTMDRHKEAGLGRDALGWHGNTGSLAINLALILGARRVFLLGYDMALDKEAGDPNWHRLRRRPGGNAQDYPRYSKQMSHIVRTLPLVFPGREIWNVSDVSKLEGFSKIGLEEHFQQQGKVFRVAS